MIARFHANDFQATEAQVQNVLTLIGGIVDDQYLPDVTHNSKTDVYVSFASGDSMVDNQHGLKLQTYLESWSVPFHAERASSLVMRREDFVRLFS